MKKEDLIIMALPSYEGDYVKSTVKLANELVEFYNVLYVDYPFTVKDLLTSFSKSHVHGLRILGIKNRTRNYTIRQNTIRVLSLPPILPINWIPNKSLFSLFAKINTFLITKTINKAIKKLKIQHPFIINAFNPVYGFHSIGKIESKGIAYYCYDEINAANWVGKHGGFYEKLFASKCDFTMVSSDNLLSVKKDLNEECYLVKNGVDFDLFNIPYSNPKNCVVYVGTIDDRLDYVLLDYIISSLPDVKFMFVGRIIFPEGKHTLEKHNNVVLLGATPYETLPQTIAGAKVGIIPFVKNEFTKNIYPLKINEYLAVGTGVVSTNFSNLSDFNDIVDIVETKELFLEALKAQMDKKVGPNTIEQRKAFAKGNSWHNRAKIINNLISKNELRRR